MDSLLQINLCSTACYTYILTALVCAIIRWFHMCRPYDQEAYYYYSARGQVTFYLLGILMLLPYVLLPEDHAVWLYARAFNMVYFPLTSATILNRYFYWRKLFQNAVTTAMFLLGTGTVTATLALALYQGGTILERNEPTLFALTVGISLCISVYYASVVFHVARDIMHYREQNYSYEEGYPRGFICRLTLLPLCWALFAWLAFLSDNRLVLALAHLVYAASTVWFLIMVLHPQRQILPQSMRNVKNTDGGRDDMVDGASAAMASPCDSVPDHNSVEATRPRPTASAPGDATLAVVPWETEHVAPKTVTENADDGGHGWTDEVRRQVLTIVGRRYREPYLKRTDVIADVPYSRKKMAGDYITSVGFYRLVNAFRLCAFNRYRVQHPELSLEGSAIACGFKDRFAMNNARKKIVDIDEETVNRYMDNESGKDFGKDFGKATGPVLGF